MSITIAIDAGHGGSNRGVERFGFVEKLWTIQCARRLYELLSHPPFVPVMLRECDEDIGLTQRGNLSKKLGADFVISLHVNATDNANASGLIPLYLTGDKTGQSVAQVIAESAPKPLLRRKPRGHEATRALWPRVVNVLGKHEPIPSNLVEFAFATNTDDREYIETDLGLHECALSAYKGCLEFWRLQG